MTETEPETARRFGGVARLYGVAGAQAIAQGHVAVVGVGGVGTWVVEALARSGVAHLTLIDADHVAESNINRQLHATDATLGMAKVQAMASLAGTWSHASMTTVRSLNHCKAKLGQLSASTQASTGSTWAPGAKLCTRCAMA
jgi:tRNA A37 threonylcarbamoyladenosine dehydratase